MTASQHHHLTPLSLFPKMFTWMIWALCGLAFYHLGWMILAPSDPSGAVSIWARFNVLASALQGLVLMTVVAMLATVLIGRILPDAGLFGACVGAAALSLRGEPVSALLTSPVSGGADTSAWGFWFALEAAIWGAGVMASAAMTFLIFQWCCRGVPADRGDDGKIRSQASMMAGADLLALRTGSGAPPLSYRLRHLGMAVIIGLIGVSLFSMDVYARTIQQGQSCFAVALSFYLASWIAHEQFRLQTPFVTLLAVPAAAGVGYLWAWVQGDTNLTATIANHIPTSVFMRTSPLLYISVGSAGVLAGFWSTRRAPQPA